MPPIPVTIHSRPGASAKSPVSGAAPTSSRYHLYPTSTPSPFYYSLTTSAKPKATTTTGPIITQTSAPESSSSTPSPTSITLTVASLAHRRKSNAKSPRGPVASLTPLLQPIISRCLHSRPPSPHSTHNALPSPPKKNGHNGFKKAPRPAPAPIHPYSRQWDTTNDRSTNPSPKEIAKAQRMELEMVKAREESAAMARAAAAAKRRKGKSRANSKGQGRSESPKDKPPTLDGEGSANVPTITTEPASNPTSPALSAVTPVPPAPAPIPPRAGLKRTRSIGLGISTATANSANGQMAVGSPLRAVTGPESPEQDGAREAKRTRLSDSDGPGRMTRRASSGSPVVAAQALPTVPAASVRRGSATGLTSEATAMRRAVSATTLAQAGSRSMARTGSAGSNSSLGEALAAGRERARREVTLPGRLRDYDMRAGTAS